MRGHWATAVLAGTAVALFLAAPLPAIAAGDRPNILVILADDLGYTDTSPFGGEMATPNLQSIANNGVRLSNFYVCPRCSNTRASLLTGLQSHTVGLPNLAGDGTLLSRNNVFIPEVLQANGYHTYMTGKWHLGSTTNFGSIPGSTGVARDPRVRGFDSYWGYTEGHSQDTFQGNYHLLSNDVPERSYTTSSGNGQPGTFYQTDAIGDYTLDFLANNRQRNAAAGTNSPFFSYVAFGAPHFPLQARDEWVDPLVSRYQVGWDQIRSDRFARMKSLGLIPQNVQLPPLSDIANTGHGEATHEIRNWNELDAARQGDLARRMAIYAAMVERMDYNIGRILNDLETHGELDNTIVMFMSDNGADGEWHEYGFNATDAPRTGAALDSMGTTTNSVDKSIFYGSGWASAGTTPYRNFKHYTHEGGIKSSAMIQWPAGMSQSLVGSIGTQVADVRDVMPTVLDLAGIDYPSQWTDRSGEKYNTRSLLGSSLADYLKTGVAIGDREMGWEHEGNRAYRIGDWKIVSSNFVGTDGKPANKWELYNLAADPTEVSDLAADSQQSARLALMIQAYDRWAYWTSVSGTMPWSAADFNRDGVLSQADIQVFVSGWRQTATFGDASTFARGDVNLDGTTDLNDFVLLRKAFTMVGQGSLLAGIEDALPLPEPTLIGTGVLPLIVFGSSRSWRRRRDSRASGAASGGGRMSRD
ncbi:MAG: sulfatase-like hydrolase/transferase [Pirellulales bacterium]